MKYEDLSPKMQELLNGLKDASPTVDAYIKDAIEGTPNEEEFASWVVSMMEELAQEACWWGKSVLDISGGGKSLSPTMKPMFQIE